MITRTQRVAAILGLLAGAASGCAAHQQESKPTAQQPTGTQAAAPQAPLTAAEQAAQADQQVAQARQQLEAAHQASIQAEQQQSQARQQLAQAEQSSTLTRQQIGAEQANVQALEQRSRDAHARAADEAMQAQVAAEQAQGLQSAEGQIAQASSSRVVLLTLGGNLVTFDIDGRTKVLMGAEQRSVADLQQGAQARVAYDPRGPARAAVAIHVMPARERPVQPQ